MKGLAWLLPADLATHADLAAEPMFYLAQALSAHVPIWTISWHPLPVAPGYHLRFWDAQGRGIVFWGQWPLSKLRTEIETYWQMEGFVPQVVLSTAWGGRLVHRWQQRFGARVIEWGRDLAFQLPGTGLGERSPASRQGSIAIPAEPFTINASLQLAADLLAAQQNVLLVGHALSATPFRNFAHAHLHRVKLALGLSWSEIESVLDQAKVVALASPSPLLARLSWGRVVAYPEPIDLPGAFHYESVAALLEMLKGSELPSPVYLAPSEAAEAAWALLSAYF